jgi:hypothetical protein
MELKEMSKEKRQLILAMMLADVFREQRESYILINEDTNIKVEDKIFHYPGEPFNVKLGSVLSFGEKEENSGSFLVIEGDTKNIVFERVSFFKAKLSPSYGADSYCVVAKDKHEAFTNMKNYCKKHNKKVDRILSMNSCDFFEPVVTRLN